MQIKFLHPITIELVETLDANGEPDQTSLEYYSKNETLEVTLVEEDDGTTQFKTAEGSVFRIEDDSFEEVE